MVSMMAGVPQRGRQGDPGDINGICRIAGHGV